MSLLGKVLLGLYVASRAVDVGAGQGRATPGYYVRDKVAAQTAPLVGIIPFDNLSDDTQADRKVLGIMVTHVLSTRAFTVVEPSVVEATLADLRLRPPLNSIQAKQLAAKLGTRLLMIGTVTEYGQPRSSGPSLTVALNARIVDTSTDAIIWAGAATKTGKPDDSLFGSGVAPSLTKLTHQSIDQLVRLMMKAKDEIGRSAGPALPVPVTTPSELGAQPNQTTPPGPGAADITTGTGPGAADTTTGTGPGAADTTTGTDPGTADTTTGTGPKPADPVSAPVRGIDNDEAVYSGAQLTAILPSELGGARRTTVVERQDCTGSIDATYSAARTPIRIHLTDSLKPDAARAVAKAAGRGGKESRLEDAPAYTLNSEFGYVHVHVSAGRFYFEVDGPTEETELIQKIASAVVKALRS